jgi:membrane protein implicated in regulation of membrane protease activity
MNAQWLLNWWNLIFLLPFGLALLYLGLYTVSGITFGDADVDADADLDTDADLDADTDLDHDLDAGHDLDADHDADADHDLESEANEIAQGPSAMSVVTWLGFGRVPVSIVLMVLMLTWGPAGFIANAALESKGASAAFISIPVAAVISILTTRLVVVFIVRYLPLYETTARRKHALLGCDGEAIFAIDHKFGMVSVRDDTGELFQVACRVEEQSEPIAKGANVRLVAYNAKQGLFYVTQRDVKSTSVA